MIGGVELTDFRVIEAEDGRWFQFDWTAPWALWSRVLEAFKQTIPVSDRRWDSEHKVWRVREGWASELGEVFPNFEKCYRAWLSQGKLFDG